MKSSEHKIVCMMGATLIALMMVLSASVAVLADNEPNNDFAEAELVYDGDLKPGTLDYIDDPYDYYKISLARSDDLDITVTAMGEDMFLMVYLYGPSQQMVAVADMDGDVYSASYRATTAGTHYIGIEAFLGTGGYTLAVEVGSTTTPPPAGGGSVNVPTLNVGDSAYFGGILDIGKEYKAEIDEALKEIKNMGFDVKIDASGGAGAYFGWEVVSNSADINGHTCYDIALMGAVGVDFGVDASVAGSIDMGEWGGTITANGKGKAVVKFEATLEGNLYLTVDQLAIAKLQLTIKADGNANVNADFTATVQGQTMTGKVDAEASANNVQFNFLVEFDPPIALYKFPMTVDSSWYVPARDTGVSGSLTASGTVSYKVDATMTGETPVKESETKNLAVEIGTEALDSTVPGGPWGGAMFTCTNIVGNIATIEVDLFGMLDDFDIPFPGTRQDFTDLFDPSDMMPTTGIQMDTTKGMMTGMTMNGEPMTEPATKAEVENFIDSPREAVTAETGGAGGGMGGLLLIIVVVVVLVVVILVVVMMAKKKKPAQHPQPYQEQPMYGPQPGYEQPPAQYPPPPEQHGNYPPPPPPGQ